MTHGAFVKSYAYVKSTSNLCKTSAALADSLVISPSLVMSVLSKNSSSNMGTHSFREFKKQASFFFKEKIKTVRLALTDVTPTELLTEEATNGNPWAPDSRTLGSISRAAFEVDDYWRIVEILHKRFLKFERNNWRASYNSLIVLEHLLTHGPESVSGEFQTDKEVIRQMDSFQYIDERGFNWGLAVRKKSERLVRLLENGDFLKDERNRSRKLTRGIQGFGSFSHWSSSAQGILQESSPGTFGRSNSQFNDHEYEENQMLSPNEENRVPKVETWQKSNENETFELQRETGNLGSLDSLGNGLRLEKPENSFKENMAPVREELHRWNCTGEGNPLLNAKKDEPRNIEEDHPFFGSDSLDSLLTARDASPQGCQET